MLSLQTQRLLGAKTGSPSAREILVVPEHSLSKYFQSSPDFPSTTPCSHTHLCYGRVLYIPLEIRTCSDGFTRSCFDDPAPHICRARLAGSNPRTSYSQLLATTGTGNASSQSSGRFGVCACTGRCFNVCTNTRTSTSSAHVEYASPKANRCSSYVSSDNGLPNYDALCADDDVWTCQGGILELVVPWFVV